MGKPISDNIFRQPNESYDDYFVRIFQNRKSYNLTFDEVAELMNKETGKNFGESAYRKEYASFNRGIKYAMNKLIPENNTRILSISDIHVPFQLPVETYSDYVGMIDILLINGDVSDCHSLSKFPKEYRSSMMKELILARKYLMELIRYLKPHTVIINYGNHDIRLSKNLTKNLDSDINELLPKTTLDLIVTEGFTHYDVENSAKVKYAPIKDVLKEEGIKIIYTESWKCKIGMTWFAHPTAYSSGILKTAQRACTYFHEEETEIFDCVVVGHTHDVGRGKRGKITLIEQGCCCDTSKLTYRDGMLSKQQKQGFVYIVQNKDGSLNQELTECINLN